MASLAADTVAQLERVVGKSAAQDLVAALNSKANLGGLGQLVSSPLTLGGATTTLGVLSLLNSAAPADGDIVPGQLFLYVDPTDAAGKLLVKGKTADGTVVTGELVLS